MNGINVLICDYPQELTRDTDFEVSLLKEHIPGAEVKILPYQDENELIKNLQGVDALLTAFIPVTENIFQKAPDLKMISVNATGVNTINLNAAAKYNVAVNNVKEYCTIEVAEHTLAMVLSLVRHLKAYDVEINNDRVWDFKSQHGIRSISSSNIALFGWGRISKEVAKRLRAFGATIMVVSKHLTKEEAELYGVEIASVNEVAENADIIINHMRQTPDVDNFFNREFFGKLKRKPVFINSGRGAAVDEDSLVEALDKDLLSGAGLDVLSSENPDLNNNLLLNRSNVIITPHTAFYSERSMKELAVKSCQNIIEFFSE